MNAVNWCVCEKRLREGFRNVSEKVAGRMRESFKMVSGSVGKVSERFRQSFENVFERFRSLSKRFQNGFRAVDWIPLYEPFQMKGKERERERERDRETRERERGVSLRCVERGKVIC